MLGHRKLLAYLPPLNRKKYIYKSEKAKNKLDPFDAGDVSEESAWMCDACGISFDDAEKFRDHVAIHGLELFPCQYCDDVSIGIAPICLSSSSST